MAILNKSQTEKQSKDYWRTSPELINDALGLLGVTSFDTDVCCSAESVKINKSFAYISEAQNALNNEWFTLQNSTPSFCNPPFSQNGNFLRKRSSNLKNGENQY